ncbi:MAG: fibro-slime domain-containing protein [Fibromonadaceae bacterium]|jgi:fibro-slime domain-containing protein|nr:fibro-slime domain-containing protein [Fibromonadaceae bacterium]
MFRRTFMPVFVLIAFLVAWGQQQQVGLDVIIRDFPVTEPGFEEFDSQKTGDSKQCNGNEAAKGMVQRTLTYATSTCPKEDIMGKNGDPDHIRYRYCSYPMPNPDAPRKCYGENLQRWFTDGSHTKTVKEVMTLTRRTDGLYEIQYNDRTSFDWNGYGATAGYFPLDKYDNKNDKAYSPDKTFGMQSLAQWCPTRSTTGNCGAWWTQGGPKDPNAAKKASDSLTSLRKDLHNFGFTVAGSAEFKYVSGSGDRFAFTGDDDMWVFIDGELVIDLGGIHSAVSDSISIDNVASARGWENGSMHSINFFYAERQTMASNLRLRFALSGLSEPRYGAPYIKKASTTIGSGGADETLIWVSTELDISSIEEIKNNGNFPIIIKKSDPSKKDSINGYRLSSIEYVGREDGSYVYLIKGDVCAGKSDVSCNLTIGSGDSLSFNVKYDDLLDAGSRDTRNVTLPPTSTFVKSRSGQEATKASWAPNSTQMNKPPFVPIPGDKNPVKPDFVDQWFTGSPTDVTGQCTICDGGLPNNGAFPNINQIWDPKTGTMISDDDLKSNNIVHGFGKTGTPIPPNRAGELLLTAYPNATPGAMVSTKAANGPRMKYEDWLKDEEAQKLFGLPPEQSDKGPYGIADPKQQAEYGGYAFVKNGFPNESSVGSNGRIAPTRCVSDLTKPNEPRINCLNFSLLARQPFQISVILYDQLGNFVTQYRETVTEREFRSVVQGPNYPNSPANSNGTTEKNAVDALSKKEDSKCKAPTNNNFGQPDVITTNGLVKVNVNIYPFSKDGRRFGNGVYIAKIDRVDLPYGGCVNNEGTPVYTTEDYKRYHADQKFGWMRTKPSTKK